MRGSTLIVFAFITKTALNTLEFAKVVSRYPKNYAASIAPQSL